jgi:hypothetical protein
VLLEGVAVGGPGVQGVGVLQAESGKALLRSCRVHGGKGAAMAVTNGASAVLEQCDIGQCSQVGLGFRV